MNVTETGHDSAKANETASASYYTVDLTRYNIKAELTPTHHSAIYRFTFPASSDANILIDCGRQIPGDIAGGMAFTEGGAVTIDNANRKITGWGRYNGGWQSDPYNIYFCAKIHRRYNHNGKVMDAFIAGVESTTQQGGDNADNVIADAYVKGVSGVDWNPI